MLTFLICFSSIHSNVSKVNAISVTVFWRLHFAVMHKKMIVKILETIHSINSSLWTRVRHTTALALEEVLVMLRLKSSITDMACWCCILLRLSCLAHHSLLGYRYIKISCNDSRLLWCWLVFALFSEDWNESELPSAQWFFVLCGNHHPWNFWMEARHIFR